MRHLAVVPTPMDASQARALTDRINAAAGELWRLLLEAHEREAWRALGYTSWREYAQAEFTISQRRAYQVLDQGRVIQAIADAAGLPTDDFCTRVQIPEVDARSLKRTLPEVTSEIRERVEAGEEPSDAAQAVVETKREERKAARRNGTPPAPEPEPDEHPEYGAPPEVDMAAELEHALEESRRLERLVERLGGGDDLAAELAKESERYARLEGRVQQMMTTEGELKRTLKYQQGLLKRIRGVLRVERNREILPRLMEIVQ